MVRKEIIDVDTVARMKDVPYFDVKVYVEELSTIFDFMPSATAEEDGESVVTPNGLPEGSAGRWIAVGGSSKTSTFDSTGSGLEAETTADAITEVVLTPITKGIQIPEPDLWYLISPTIMFFRVLDFQFPQGIVIDQIDLDCSEAAAMTLSIYDMASLTDGSPRTILTVDLGGAAHATAIPDAEDADVLAGRVVGIGLDTTDVDLIYVTATFHRRVES